MKELIRINWLWKWMRKSITGQISFQTTDVSCFSLLILWKFIIYEGSTNTIVYVDGCGVWRWEGGTKCLENIQMHGVFAFTVFEAIKRFWDKCDVKLSTHINLQYIYKRMSFRLQPQPGQFSDLEAKTISEIFYFHSKIYFERMYFSFLR